MSALPWGVVDIPWALVPMFRGDELTTWFSRRQGFEAFVHQIAPGRFTWSVANDGGEAETADEAKAAADQTITNALETIQ